MDLTGENNIGLGRAVNTVCLDTDKNTTTGLQKEMGIEANNTSLIWLSNIGKYTVNHSNQHSVAEWVTGILNNGDDVGAVSGHSDQVTSRAVGEFNGVDGTRWANNVSYVTDGCSAGSSKIKDLGAWLHGDLLNTAKNTGGQLASEWIPYTVFDFGCWGISVLRWRLDGDSLFTIDSFTRGQVLGNKEIFLTATSDEDTGMAMGFLLKTNDR